MKKVKIVRFNARHNIGKGEKEIEELLNQGWEIASMGGVQNDCVVVMVREEQKE